MLSEGGAARRTETVRRRGGPPEALGASVPPSKRGTVGGAGLAQCTLGAWTRGNTLMLVLFVPVSRSLVPLECVSWEDRRSLRAHRGERATGMLVAHQSCSMRSTMRAVSKRFMRSGDSSSAS